MYQFVPFADNTHREGNFGGIVTGTWKAKRVQSSGLSARKEEAKETTATSREKDEASPKHIDAP